MANKTYKLGELIEVSDERNLDNKYTLDDVKGISIQKIFIETKADMKDVSLTPYILVKPDYFCYVTVTSRNGEKITLAHNNTKDTYIVSSSYIVFYIKRPDLLNSDYLYMYFNRPEFDRFSRFNSWGSAREVFSWNDLCDIDITLPELMTQEKYVEIYKSLVENQKSYERGLDDLKLTCDAYIEELRRKIPCEAIKPYIQQTKNKNESLKIIKNKAVSNTKKFIDANDSIIAGVDTANYLIVNKNEFAYNSVTTRNADKLSIAINKDKESLVSPIYITFKVIADKLLPEYLFLWFLRSEYDRYARFNSWGSARESYTFDELSETKIPIPSINIQKTIVDVFNIYDERKQINEKLKSQIKDICPILIKGSLEEAKEA